MKIDLKAAGQRIKDIRCQHNYSMARFSKLVGNSSASTVNNWEKGNNLPKEERLEKLAILGNTTVNWIRYGSFEEYVVRLLSQNRLNGSLQKEQLQQLMQTLKKQKISYLQDLEILTIAHELFPNLFETTYQISRSQKNNLVISEDSMIYRIEQDDQYRTDFLPKIDALFHRSSQKQINDILLFQLFDLLERTEENQLLPSLTQIFSIIADIVTNDISYDNLHKEKIVNYSALSDKQTNQKKLSDKTIQKRFAQEKETLLALLDAFYIDHNEK
ncbi:helix-turn-helix domain-containing protein [Enterococcus wangshanyuanii]|uniref:HTH cro/C1-type domain-containing protein n=1 Tax=Enterococcus wangshanyuanii TaxID=2005703 RepID=A0ABQ1NL28_9ENTE|nr:helix-turn-helix transcriptional regulator [Enterococcus wangshanyuanii]GGC79899.1 hypothetical protein GCM10011573_06980 [Enterococcus wangshanyuanii]